MAVSVETLEGLERKIILSLPWESIRAQTDARLNKIRKTAKIDGFRPGKVPLGMIQNMYGASAQEEVLNKMAQEFFETAVRENQLPVVALNSLNAEENQDDESVLKVAAVFEVYPEISVGDLSAQEIEQIVGEVTDADLEKTLDILRRQRTRYEYADRAAQKGDRVIIDFAGTIGGEAFAGGSAENYPFVLGAGQMLPEFENGIEGMKENESKEVSVTFPEDYHGKEVAGKTAIFAITLKNVSAPVLPEVDADFARSLGIEDGDVEKLHSEIRKNITREAKRRRESLTKENVMKALLKAVEVDVPQALLRAEIRRRREAMQENFRAQGLDTAGLAHISDDAFSEQARERVALGLILSELVDKNNLRATDEQIRAEIEDLAQSYEDPQEVIDWYYSDRANLENPAAAVTENNVVAFVLQQAKVTDKKMDFSEVMGQTQPAL